MSNLVFGCGYLGLRVAELWKSSGEEVFAVTRSAERCQHLQQRGLTPIVADITQPDTLRGLPPVDTVLFAVGFDRRSGQSIQRVYVDGLQAALEAIKNPPQRFIYISSTGVYGQVEGDEVDETSPCRPQREGGKACLAAEQMLHESRLAAQTIILRLAGIYGPGRIPRSADIRAGLPIDAPSQGYLNLIHVEDAARIVVAAAQRLAPPKLYVVSDGHPVVRHDYYAELARLLGAPPPTFAAPAPNSPAAQRAGSDKRVQPARLYADLPMRLQYPTYREGLAAIVRDELSSQVER